MTLEQQIYELQTELRCCDLTSYERQETETELAKVIQAKSERDQAIARWKLEIPT